MVDGTISKGTLINNLATNSKDASFHFVEYGARHFCKLLKLAASLGSKFLMKSNQALTLGKVGIQGAAITANTLVDLQVLQNDSDNLAKTAARMIETSPVAELQRLHQTEAALKSYLDSGTPLMVPRDLGGLAPDVEPLVPVPAFGSNGLGGVSVDVNPVASNSVLNADLGTSILDLANQ